MKNYIILHGTGGSKDGNWFPWLKGEIEKRGFLCRLEQFPIGLGIQNYENWAAVFDKYNINEETIVFAHSLAPIFVVRYLMENNKTIAKLVSVAGFNSTTNIVEINAMNETFLVPVINNFEKHCRARICLYSNNDPYVAFENQDKFATDINAQKIIIEKGGHLNAESGYTELETLLLFL
jgi:predicted alpha/beta hydrolase family esterase